MGEYATRFLLLIRNVSSVFTTAAATNCVSRLLLFMCVLCCVVLCCVAGQSR